MRSMAKTKALFSFALLGTLCLAGPARGETPPEEPAVTARRTEELASRFNVEKSAVETLRKDGMGWGEISHLLAVSRKSGETPETIQALRKDGMGWGEIAKKYGLNLGEINKDVHAADRALKRADRARIEKQERERMEKRERVRMERPPRMEREKPVRPDRSGRPDTPVKNR